MKRLSYLSKAAGVVAIGALGSAGAVMLLAAGTGTALAQPGTCVASTVNTDPNCQTQVSVSIASSTTLADNTPSITLTPPVALPGDANTQDVSLTVTSNDASGWAISATPSGDFASSNGHSIPVSCLYVGPDATYGVSGGPFDFGGGTAGNLGTGCGTDTTPTSAVETDAYGALATNVGVMDSYSMWVPNVPAGTYTTTLTYSISGN